MTIHRETGDGRTPLGHLPTVRVHGVDDPVVELRTSSEELVYTRRLRSAGADLPVFEPGTHVLRVGDPDRGLWLERTIQMEEWDSRELEFDFGG